MKYLLIPFLFFPNTCYPQLITHPNAHAHNDYEHKRPLKEALQNGFLSVEADIHLLNGRLLVGHDRVTEQSPTLEQLYLHPLDSLLRINNGYIYSGEEKSFFLMIDIKSDAEVTYQALKQALNKYERLKCKSGRFGVSIYLSGNRALDTILKEGYDGIAIDGRPENCGKGISNTLMPVISDNYWNWSNWQGKQEPLAKDLVRIRELAQRVHSEGKKLRLWAIPDNELAWNTLLDAGVDLINTDRLAELNAYLSRQGK